MRSSTTITVPAGPTWAVLGVVGTLLAILLAGPLLTSALSPRTAFAAEGDTPPEHTIAVSGTGKVVVVPDLATVRLGVLVERDGAKAARTAAAESMTAVVAAIRALGIDEKDIATATVSLQPVYDYPVNGQARIRGYQVSNQVTVTVRNLDLVSDVIDDGVQAGATTVDGVSFDVADRTAAEADAREAAVADAKAKADALASGLGVNIQGVASVSEQVSSPVWYDRGYGLSAPQAGEAAADTPVMPGTTDIVINVQVVFLIP
jgi:uncharacterized protein YggE